MNIRDLTYLIALEKYRNFTKAAEMSFVSQPALSMQIKKLEDELSVQLIERQSKTLLFTEVGMRVLTEAKVILTHVNVIKDLGKIFQDHYCGDFYLGVIPTLGPYLLPKLLAGFSALLPKVKFYFIEEQTAALLVRLKEGGVDAAILALPVIEEELDSTFLFEELFYLALSAKHSWAHREEISTSDLKNETLLLLGEGHCLRDQTLEICEKTHAHELLSFQALSLETLRNMVAMGVGITLMPALARKENDGLVYLPFQDNPPSRKIGLVYRRSSPRHLLLERLCASIRRQFA